MSFRQRKAEFEERARSLLGEKIIRVRYLEIDYGMPGWDFGHLHSADFGVDLETESGGVFCLIWDFEFVQHGLSLKRHSCEYQISAAVSWDVSNEDEWRPLLHHEVSDVEVYWSWFENVQDGVRRYYPQDFVFSFEHDQRVFFSAADYQPDTDELWNAGADNVAVVFSERSAQRYGLGPYAKPG